MVRASVPETNDSANAPIVSTRQEAAALETLLEVAFDGPRTPLTGIEYGQWKVGAEQRARAAIAAATGGQP